MKKMEILFHAWKSFAENGIIDTTVLRKEIAESWKRCLYKYRLDPYAKKSSFHLSEEQIDEQRTKSLGLMESARPFLHLLETAVKQSGSIISLSDREGFVLVMMGDKEILEMAKANNYMMGCRRTEAEVGTNSIGLSLHEKKAVQVTGPEHFNINHHTWACSSSPIFFPDRELVGVITLSGKSTGIHQHTLGMVISAALAIENKIAERQLSEVKDSLNSYLDSLLDSVCEGIIAVEKDGRITHANRIAENMLKISQKEIVGKLFGDVLKIGSFDLSSNCQMKDQETTVDILGRVLPLIVSSKPILLNGVTIGKILILTARQRVYELIQKFSGRNARFTFNDIIGRNQQLLRQIELAKIACNADSRILIMGESGTGKELFAQAIHNQGKRRNGPFVALNCGAIPRDLIEAELFGYQGGAFTGSKRGGQIGKFEIADKGTLFLDEIDSMPFDMQTKILRVLEENEIVRLGDTKPRKIDIQVLAATSRDLLAEVKKRNFREDLFFRLNVVEIIIPPLRERLDDLPYLIEHILSRISGQIGRGPLSISEEAMSLLFSYAWPGNVRELENYLERASLICRNGTIDREDLPIKMLVEADVETDGENRLVRSIKEQEEFLIREALRKCNGNISETARKLGLSRSTVHRRLNRNYSPRIPSPLQLDVSE